MEHFCGSDFYEKKEKHDKGENAAHYVVAATKDSRGKLFPVGCTLLISFLPGDYTNQLMKIKVAEIAREWCKFANIKFVFDFETNYYQELQNSHNSDRYGFIRIKFDSEQGNWSYIGKSSYSVPLDQCTMNFGALNITNINNTKLWKRIVLHEFGHALGLQHEHQSPNISFKWNVINVWKDIIVHQCWGWSLEKIDDNIFKRYSNSNAISSKFDADSIMLYEFPRTWVIGETIECKRNDELSIIDKMSIQLYYPFRTIGDNEK